MGNADKLSRRHLIAGLTAAGASSLLPIAAEPQDRPQPPSLSPMTPSERKQAQERLIAYVAGTAPQLLRPADGILQHPSIAPSLPGKTYSTSLWDWDTYWTTRGLFAYARISTDRSLHQQICEHAVGSLMNFFDHQSSEGRIPIMIDVHQSRTLCSAPLEKASPNIRRTRPSRSLVHDWPCSPADELGSVSWLTPLFDDLMRFYSSWVLGNQSSVGLLVWGDDVAIGNDNDPTTFGRPFFSSANLLLNCLFFQDLKASAELATRLNRTADSQRLTTQADQLGRNRFEKAVLGPPRQLLLHRRCAMRADRRAELIPSVKPRNGQCRGSLCRYASRPSPDSPAAMVRRSDIRNRRRKLVHTNYLADDRFNATSGVHRSRPWRPCTRSTSARIPAATGWARSGLLSTTWRGRPYWETMDFWPNRTRCETRRAAPAVQRSSR